MFEFGAQVSFCPIIHLFYLVGQLFICLHVIMRDMHTHAIPCCNCVYANGYVGDKMIHWWFIVLKLELLEHGLNLRTITLLFQVMENLENLTNLQELWLGRNRIKAVNLCGLKCIKKLSLQSNRLTSMKGFEVFWKIMLFLARKFLLMFCHKEILI